VPLATISSGLYCVGGTYCSCVGCCPSVGGGFTDITDDWKLQYDHGFSRSRAKNAEPKPDEVQYMEDLTNIVLIPVGVDLTDEVKREAKKKAVALAGFTGSF
jgi:hypothetical protein